jgi:uracil-DNA glycosylase
MPPKAITSYFKPAAPAGAALASTRRTPRPAKPAADAKPPPAKRAKLSTASAGGLGLPRAQSREELRAALAAHPTAAKLLKLELDTLGEDWLLALQDELTKPYFLKVGWGRNVS